MPYVSYSYFEVPEILSLEGHRGASGNQNSGFELLVLVW